MIGVVIPAHNEEQLIARCLQHIQLATQAPLLNDEQVVITVVADDCTDRTGVIAESLGATVVTTCARNVGVARAAGASVCLKAGARWLAFTDADTEVSQDWLVQQLLLGKDAVCGTVAVADWGEYGVEMRQHYAATYTDADNHRHIHGANLGVSADAYRRAGGFPPVACSEDVALVDALERTGAVIGWSARPRVWTSARKDFRAAGGFGATLLRVDTEARARADAPC